MSIYLDNAASTPLDKEVLDAMLPYLSQHHGNPSSTHRFGRETREAIEKARRTIADILQASPWEIFFTSGATEANNLALTGSIHAFTVRHIITSRIEHKAVLNGLLHHAKRGRIRLSFVDLDANGHLDYEHLERLLRLYPNSLVSLMHGNNELGNINNLVHITELGRRYGAFVHSDTVQTLQSYAYNLQKTKVDFLVGSAHKFHGPKGIGFLYVNKRVKTEPLLHGGSQEKNLRAGTENVSGIVGLAKALEIAHHAQSTNRSYLEKLKIGFINELKQSLPDVRINGDGNSLTDSLPHLVNVSFPKLTGNETLLQKLDEQDIAASGGSACNESVYGTSHVLKEIKADPAREHIRFSFSKYTTTAELSLVVKKISEFYPANKSSLTPEFHLGEESDAGYCVRQNNTREFSLDMIFD